MPSRGRRCRPRAVGVEGRIGRGSQLQAGHRAARDVAADVVGVVALDSAGAARCGPGRGRGTRGRSARSGPRCARSCRRSSRWARGSRPTACACPRARVWGRPGSAAPTSTKGRSGVRPRHGQLGAATSSRVPPTCTVPAWRHSSAFHGTGPSRAQSTLNEPARSGSARAGAGSAAAGGRRRARSRDGGVVSRNTAPLDGS